MDMDRRTFVFTLPTVPTALLYASEASASTQDVEYLRALERAQRDRPLVLTSHGRIAPSTEPGTPLVIHGRVYRPDGTTPAPGIIVFAYHTDATGLYDAPSAGPHSWRLRGWVRTDADGRFEFTTIRPAPYPSRRTAAHVHVTIEGPGVPRQPAGLVFDGDPLLTEDERQQSVKAGRFGTVRPIELKDGIEQVTLAIRIEG
jgi:protocatechuate 3,4-dioxygenase beta subunit